MATMRPKWMPVFSEGFSFAFLVTSVISMYTFELLVVLPESDEGLVPFSVHIVLGTFIFINILSNLAMMMYSDTTTRGIMLPSVLKQFWRFCPSCEANSPPRSYHCDKCKNCVLKRDHHCTFAGCCVGLKNFRYYFLFLFYLAIGSCYATVFNMYFIWEKLGGISLFSVSAHIIPFLFWILGYLSLQVFSYTMMSVLSVVGILFVTHLLVLHGRQMLHNQTTYEKNQGVLYYDLGWKQNVIESLGVNWHLSWVFPLIKSPLPSDGLQFYTKDNFVKNAIKTN